MLAALGAIAVGLVLGLAPVATATANVTVETSVAGTSVDGPGNDLTSQATIGETITYRITVTVPTGTTLHGTPTLTDAVEPRMALRSTPAPTVAQSGGTAMTPPPTATVTGNQLDVAFPSGYANTAGEDAVFTVDITAQVRDVAESLRGATLSNSADFSWQPSATEPVTTQTGTAPDVTIVEPRLETIKTSCVANSCQYTNSTVSIGETYLYRLQIGNSSAGGVSSSHDTLVIDTLPDGFIPLNVDGDPAEDGDAIGVDPMGAQNGIWDEDDGTITWTTIGTLAPGSFTILDYLVRVRSPAPAGQTYPNTVVATGTSLSGTDANERTVGSTQNTGYTSTSQRTVTLAGGALTKTAASTRASIGDLIDYAVEYTLPPNVAFNDLTFVDVLPDGIEYVSGSAQTACVGPPACTLTGTAASPVELADPLRNPATGTRRIAWVLDDISHAASARTVRLTYQGRIMASYAAIATTAPVSAGDVLTNSVTALYNAEDDGGPPVTIPDPDDYDQVTAAQTAAVTVEEPRITLDKHVSGTDVADPDDDRRNTQPGDTYTYTVKVTNDGASPAYDVQVADALSAKLTNVVLDTPPTGTTVTDGDASDGTLGWTISVIAPNASVTLTYAAKLADSSLLSANETVVNTATVPSYWNASETERGTDPDDGFREYTTDPPADTVTLDVRLPNVTVQKTTGGTGFPEHANAVIGESFPWRVVISNLSPSSVARDVAIRDLLPAGWTYDDGSATLAPTPSVPGFDAEPTITEDDTGDILSWADIGDIAPGHQVVLTFTATPGVGSRANPIQQQNAVEVTANDSDGQPASADGPYGDDDTAQANLQLPVLTIAKTPDGTAPGGAADAGSTPTYSIVIRNASTIAPARNVIVTDTLQAYQTYTAGTAKASTATGPLPAAEFTEVAPVVDDNQTADPADDTTKIDWQIDQIPPDSAVTITVPVTLDADLPAGTTVRNGASVVSREIVAAKADEGSFTTTVDSDVGVTKTITAPTGDLVPGEQVTYTLEATNHGPSVATGVEITDDLPDGLTLNSPPTDCTVDRQTVACPLGTLGVGASKSVTLTATIDPSATGTLTNDAEVSSESPDSDDTNDRGSASRDLSPLADLVVSKTASTTAVHQGDELSYEITVRNAGPSDAVGVKLRDPLPAPGVVLASTAPTTDVGSCSPTGDTVDCTIGTLAPNQTATVTVYARAVNVGTFVNEATATTTTLESSTSNNAGSDDIEIKPVADVGIEQTAAKTVAGNGTLIYSLRLFNDGPSDATGVTVTDALPDGVDFVSADAGCTLVARTVTCAIGDLDAGDAVTREIVVRVPFALGGQTLINTASITGDQLDRTPDNDSAQARTIVGDVTDLAVTKTAGGAVAGQMASWNVMVTNNGPNVARDVVLSDTLPAGTTFRSAHASVGGGCNGKDRRVACNLGTIAVGGSAQATIVAIVAPGTVGQRLRNVATASSATPDRDPSNDAATADVVVTSPPPTSPDLRVTKIASTTKPQLGRPLTYRIEVTNRGNAAARAVRLTDTMNRDVRVTRVNASQGTCKVAGTATSCQLGTIAPGQKATVDVRVIPESAGTLRNTVSVQAAGQTEARIDDNQAVANVRVGTTRTTLTLRKQASRRQVPSGGRVTFTITAKMGKHAGSNVRICDRLPRGLSFVRATGAGFSRGQACWTVRYLAAGKTMRFRIVARSERSDRTRTIRNTAVVRARNVKRRTASARVQVTRTLAAPAGGVTG